MHMPLHIASHSKWLPTHSTLVGLFTSVYTTMVLQITARSESFVAILAAVIFFTGVDPSVNDQRVFPREILATVLALILLLLRVNTSRVVLQISPLTKVATTFFALVGLVATVKALVDLDLKKFV